MLLMLLLCLTVCCSIFCCCPLRLLAQPQLGQLQPPLALRLNLLKRQHRLSSAAGAAAAHLTLVRRRGVGHAAWACGLLQVEPRLLRPDGSLQG
jgi:hypothetical protein